MRGLLRHEGGPISAAVVIDELCPDLPAFERLLHHENERTAREQGELKSPAAIVRFLEIYERLEREHPELDLTKRVPYL